MSDDGVHDRVSWALRDMAANLLRMICGCGKLYDFDMPMDNLAGRSRLIEPPLHVFQ